jgi:hypothetical protein
MTALSLSCAVAAIGAGQVAAQGAGGMPPEVTRDPDAVLLQVGDLRRLAGVLRSLGESSVVDTAAHIQQQYLAHASPGLRAYVERYDVDGAGITAALRSNPAAYADLDGLAERILALEPEFRVAFRKLQELFPETAFPTVWFVAGAYGPGGIARPEGAIVAAERFVGEVEKVVPIALHEVAHFQQAMVQGVETYRRIYEPGTPLLALALREGSAELIAELTTGQHVNTAAERYGLPREAEIWTQFSADMRSTGTGEWMFVRPQDPARPADLGYWVGYRIVRRYYDQATDKRQAIRDIMRLTDFEAFLQASGYGQH